jgi:hypothetical protein
MFNSVSLFDYYPTIVQLLFSILTLEMYSRYFDPVNCNEVTIPYNLESTQLVWKFPVPDENLWRRSLTIILEDFAADRFLSCGTQPLVRHSSKNYFCSFMKMVAKICLYFLISYNTLWCTPTNPQYLYMCIVHICSTCTGLVACNTSSVICMYEFACRLIGPRTGLFTTFLPVRRVSFELQTETGFLLASYAH